MHTELLLAKTELTGTPEEIESKYNSYTEIALAFNEPIARMYILTVQNIWNEPKATLTEGIGAIMLTLKVLLDFYFEQTYPEGKKPPPDLGNLGYYLEQCMASLSAEYTELKMQTEQPHILIPGEN